MSIGGCLSRAAGAIGVMPPERFDQELHYDPREGVPAKSYSRIAGLLSARLPDLSAWPLSESLIEAHDPSHLALYDAAVQAFRDAGLDPFGPGGRRCGVYSGHSRGSSRNAELIYGALIEQKAGCLRELAEFREICGGQGEAVIDEIVAEVRRKCPRRDPRGGPFLESHQAAGLLSKAFALDGLSLAINAVCAFGAHCPGHGGPRLATGRDQNGDRWRRIVLDGGKNGLVLPRPVDQRHRLPPLRRRRRRLCGRGGVRRAVAEDPFAGLGRSESDPRRHSRHWPCLRRPWQESPVVRGRTDRGDAGLRPGPRSVAAPIRRSPRNVRPGSATSPSSTPWQPCWRSPRRAGTRFPSVRRRPTSAIPWRLPGWRVS